MRNLKKILALVLALMMVLSVMATASALDFADASEIEKTEAVSVMAGLEILAGKPTADGEFNFDPQGTLKRQEAAKILAYVMTGDYEHITEGTAALSHPFTDVVKGDWAEAYITYCYNAGLMNGNGKGTFGYNQTLSGYALGKMLLCAVGIGTASDYEGLGWELAVYKALKANNLLTDVTVNSKAITREDACQLIWNVMNWTANAQTVKYIVWVDTNEDGLVSEGETVVYEGTDRLSSLVASLKDGTSFKEVTVNTGSLADKIFGVTFEEKVDDFGRVTHVYESTLLEDMEVVVVVDTDATVLTAKVAGTALDVINTTLGLKDDDCLKASEAGMAVWVNGVKDGGYDVKAGDTIEIYLDKEGDITKVIAISESFMQVEVDEDSEIKTGENKGKYVWTFANNEYTVTDTAAYTAYTDEGYYLAVVKADGSKILAATPVVSANIMENVKTVQGEFEGAYVTEYIVIDGVKYPLATSFDSYCLETSFWYNVTVDVVMNSNGYVIAVTDPDAVEITELPWGYAYLMDAELLVTRDDTKGDLINIDGVVNYTVETKAKLALPDGTYTVVDLTYTAKTTELKVDGVAVPTTGFVKPVKLIGNATYPVYAAKGWVKYTIKTDGTYTLTAVETLGSALTLTKGDANIGGLPLDVYATSNTEWNLYNFDEATQKASVTTVTGYKNFAKNGVTLTSIEKINKLNEHLVDLVDSFKFTPKAAPAVTTTNPYAFYLGEGDWYEDGKVAEYMRKFAVNGKLDDCFLADLPIDEEYEALDGVNKIYKLTLDSKGDIKAAEAVDAALIGEGTVKFVDPGKTYIILDVWGEDVEMFLAEGVQIINVAGDEPTGEFDEVVGALNDRKLSSHGDKVYFVTKGATGADARVIVTIFIYENAQ